jgi:hypothetical protein
MIAVLFLLLPLLGLAGCASQPALTEENRLPFHVALVPVTVTTQDVASAELQDQSEDDTILDFTIDGDLVSRELSSELRRAAFVRVTLLDRPAAEGQGASAGETGIEEVDPSWWIEQARASGADLLLVPTVSHSPGIRQERGAWYITIPVFLFTGPVSWIVKDRRYEADVTLTAVVHNVNGLRSVAAYEEESAIVVDAETRFKETNLKFTDRAESPLSYLNSIIWPAGWLVSRTDSARESTTRKAVAVICEQITRELALAKKDDLVRAPLRCNHYVEEGTVSLVRTAPDSVQFEADLLLNTARVDRLKSYQILAASAPPREKRFGEYDGLPDERKASFLRYHIKETLSLAPDVASLRLLVTEGGEEAQRSYTFPIGSPVRN